MKNFLAVTSLALALAAAGCGSDDEGSSTESAAPAASTPATATGGRVAVDIKGFTFVPRELTTTVGTTIEWENSDSAPHNVVASDDTFKSETLEQGDTFEYTADKAGTYEYVCTFHSQMTATLTVTD